MGLLQYLYVLQYRNLCIRRHRWFAALVEILLPVAIFGILISIYSQSFSKVTKVRTYKQDEIIYEPKDLPQVISSEFYISSIEIVFSPKNDVAIKILNKTKAILQEHGSKKGRFEVNLQNFENEEEVVRYMTSFSNQTYMSRKYFGIIFTNLLSSSSDIPDKVEYKLRALGGPFDTATLISGKSSSYFYSYSLSGFTSLEWAINEAIFQLSVPNHKTQNVPSIYIEQFPTPAENHDDFASGSNFLSQLLPPCTLMGFFPLIPLLLQNIISEKESGAKELMKMMGLKNWMTWAGWAMHSLTSGLISITLISIFLCVNVFNAGSGAVLKSSITFVWVFLLFYFSATICFCFAISPFFKRPTIATCVGLILWSALNYSSMMDHPSLSPYRGILFLSPNIVMSRGWDTIRYYEELGPGVHWSDLFNVPYNSKLYSLSTLFISFILQDIVLLIIAVYFDAVWPGSYGIRKSPLFFLKKSYWFKNVPTHDNNFSDNSFENRETFEPVSSDLEPGIRVRNVRKSFRNVNAVNGISLNLYKGEITALLGHNGAGKTTTMSILTGMIPADSGAVFADDYNIFEDISTFRENLGLCPQHNLLFPNLNVIEHLIFFGMLKGLRRKEAKLEGFHLLELQNMNNKSKAMASQLSGGMKRKLSLAIALIGSPKILMLDEPTSGMDPESRREMWDLLLSMRGERTIILTTHFMEEADVLGDRIVIMDHGEIKCHGTSIFLKKLYGAGYTLKILKDKNFKQDRRDLITSAVQEFIPEAIIKTDEGPKLTYVLPTELVDVFPNMFSKLESLKNELTIAGIGIDCTTMEEVFLKVGEIAATEREGGDDLSGNSQELNNYDAELLPQMNTRSTLLLQQFSALLSKKLTYSYRRWLMYSIFALTTLLAVIFMVLVKPNGYDDPNEPALTLDFKLYDFVQSYYHTKSSSDPLINQIKELAKPKDLIEIPSDMDTVSYLLKLGSEDSSKYFSSNSYVFDSNGSSITSYFNKGALHSMVTGINVIYNALLKLKAGKTLSVTNHPIPITQRETTCSNLVTKVEQHALAYILLWSITLGIMLIILTGSFIAFPIGERLNNGKQLQLMTGVSPILYWFTTFIVDYCYYLLICLVCLLILVVSHTFSWGSAGAFLVIIIIYGLGAIAFAYFISFFRKAFSNSYTVYVNLSMFVGFIAAAVVYVLKSIEGEQIVNPIWISLAVFVFAFLPHFSFLMTFFSFVRIKVNNDFHEQCPNSKELHEMDYFTFSKSNFIGLNDYLCILIFDFFFYSLVIVLIDYGWMEKLHNILFNALHGISYLHSGSKSEDSDIRVERDRVDAAREEPVRYRTSVVFNQRNNGAVAFSKENISEHTLIVDNLVKKFSRSFAAVRGVSFAVKPGECFGLLGVNGAGKTTTFRMITGDTLPTIGECSIFSHELSKDRKKYLSMIGYCPQFDGINEFLTGKEMLELFALLRGVHRSKVKQQIEKWVEILSLSEYKDKQCGTYSGGNKRKLSAAMALIGDPSLIVLDEPTSGVDPIARRKLWNVLMEARKRGQAIVFTSHSMDECETLCDRLTIMVGGEMMCIGNVEYLKKRYGQGFTLTIKVVSNTERANVENLKRVVEDSFPGKAVLKDEHTGYLHYHITDPTIPLSTLFTKMQHNRETLDIIEDYNICDTTLEQVFLAFARSEAKIISE